MVPGEGRIMPRYDIVFSVLARLEELLTDCPGGISFCELLKLARNAEISDSIRARDALRNIWYGDPRFIEETDHLRAATAGEIETLRLAVDFVILDLETTGIGPAENRIIEIGAVTQQNGQVCETFHSLLAPDIPLAERITRLTGITSEMLKKAPGCQSVLPDFDRFCSDLPRVAHNAPFDASFLFAEAERAGIPLPTSPWLCTARLTRLLLPDQEDYHLDSLTGRFGLTITDRHRSIGDVIGTAGVFAGLHKTWTAHPERIKPLG